MNTFNKQMVETVQKRLKSLGWYGLKIDGIPGVGTQDAMTRMKEAFGYRARAYPGPLTMELLFSDEAPQKQLPQPIGNEPAWLTEARSLINTMEYAGSANNPEIMQWADDLDQWYTGDDVPWCGLFVAHCMAVGAPQEPQDFNRLGARAWRNYGAQVDEHRPPLGSVCILWRTHPTKSWNGHVFIVTGQSDDAIRGIGGNQSDNVTEAWFSRNRVLACRVPTGYEGPPAPRAITGELSTNEA